jgi:2,5-dihydroxypyridine 5,6-dioxygenase
MLDQLNLLVGAENCVRFGNVRPGEQVLVVAEPGIDAAVVGALTAAAKSAGGQVSTLIVEPLGQGDDLSPVMAAALQNADVVFQFGSPSAHTEAGFLACFDYGTRNLALRPDALSLASAAARFPVEDFFELGRRVQGAVRAAGQLHVTADNGTDLRMQVPAGAVGGYIGPLPYEPGLAVPGYLGSFPPGSCVWSDPGYTANGRLALDAAYRYPDLRAPIVWEIKDGWVTDISGGHEAEAVAQLLVGIENANRLAECGFGLNPRVEFLPSVSATSDQRATVVAWTRRAGVFFVGMGSDVLQGGKDRSQLSPIYGLVKEPTVLAGETLVVERGRLVAPEEVPIPAAIVAPPSAWPETAEGSLQQAAARFFGGLDASPAPPLADYPIDLRLETPDETARIGFSDGRVDPDAAASDYWKLELRSDGAVFREIFAGYRTMGQAFYDGQLHAPEEKAKHNLVVALSWTVRLLQQRS